MSRQQVQLDLTEGSLWSGSVYESFCCTLLDFYTLSDRPNFIACSEKETSSLSYLFNLERQRYGNYLAQQVANFMNKHNFGYRVCSASFSLRI